MAVVPWNTFFETLCTSFFFLFSALVMKMTECCMRHLRHLRHLVHVVAFAFLTLQLVLAVQKYMAKPIMTSPGTKPFSSLTKPLKFTVCKVEQFNYIRAAGLGYSAPRKFLAGYISNQTVLSWTGLNENRTFEETLSVLYNSTDKTTFNSINSGPNSGNFSTKFILPFGLCNEFEGKSVRRMAIKLETKEMVPHILFISDPSATTSFQLPYSLMSGDRNKFQLPHYVVYNIKIKETTVFTDDGSCVDYPNSNHESYSDCVDAEMNARILPSVGCMIPWISPRDRCTKRIQRLPKHKLLLSWIFIMIENSWGGIEYKSESCPPSCTRLSINSEKILSGYNTVKINLWKGKKKIWNDK